MIPATAILARKYGVRMARAAVLLAAVAFEPPWSAHGSAQAQQHEHQPHQQMQALAHAAAAGAAVLAQQLDELEQVTRAAGTQRLVMQSDVSRSPNLDWHVVDRTRVETAGALASVPQALTLVAALGALAAWKRRRGASHCARTAAASEPSQDGDRAEAAPSFDAAGHWR